MTKVMGYQPTQEQLEAQKARREAQKAAKEAKHSKTGNKTVFDKKAGKYISLDAATINQKKAEKATKLEEAKKAKEASKTGSKTVFDKKAGKYISLDAATINQKKAEKAAKLEEAKKAKEASKFGGKTIPDPHNPGKYISISADEVKQIYDNKIPKKSGGLFSKIGKFFKGKGGKAAIGAGIVALLAAGGTWIYNKVSGKKDDQPVNSNNNTTPTTPVAPTDSTEVKPPVTPTPGGNDTTPNEPTDPVKPGNNDNNNNNVPKDYVVKKGDCVWNIAKQHLKDLSNDPNYKPTDAEILKHTKELMELNKLQFEPDGYHVMIKPEDKLKLVA